MANKATSLNINTSGCLINSLDVHEQFQRLSLRAENTLVDARGMSDRYKNKQVVKQKQTGSFTFHWYNSTTALEATNLDISLYTLGGTAQLSTLKSGNIEIVNEGPETSGIAESYEWPQVTSTDASITSDVMIISEAYWTYLSMQGTFSQLYVLANITFAGENVQIPGVVNFSEHSFERGGVQLENVKIDISGGSPTTPADTSSLLYLALVGSASTTSFQMDTGVNAYSAYGGQSFIVSRYGLKFAEKALIEQTCTVEPQGGMNVSAGA